MAKRDKKICLTMIVKNEAHCITNCLDSYKDSIDLVAFVDTGSTDSTKEVIRDYLRKHKIKGGVISKPWGYFAISRNDSIEYAYSLIREYHGLPPTGPLLKEEVETIGKQWHLLFTDADNRIVNEGEKCFSEEQCRNGNFSPVNLKAKLQEIPDAELYFITMRSGTSHYIHRTLVQVYPTGSRGHKYLCPIHEYLSNYGWEPNQQTLKGVYCFSGRHGGRSNTRAKADYDAAALMVAIKECRISAKDYDRCLFYLAQSYRDACEYEISYKYYLKRAQMKTGFYEERYYSYLRCAQLIPFTNIGITDSEKMNIRLDHLKSAFEIAPYRREAIFDLLVHYDKTKQFKFIWAVVKDHIKDNNPNRYTLFVDSSLYGARFDEKAALVAFYAGDNVSFYTYNERALKDPDIDDVTRNRLLSNRKFYSNDIKSLANLVF